MYKKAWCTSRVWLFCQSKPFSFCRSRCRRRRRCLSSLALWTQMPSILVISNLLSLLSLGMKAIVMAPEVLHLAYHKSVIGISVLEQPYLRTRHGEPELTQPRSKPQQRIKSQMTWKFFSPERGGVSPEGRTPIWKQREFSSSRFGV